MFELSLTGSHGSSTNSAIYLIPVPVLAAVTNPYLGRDNASSDKIICSAYFPDSGSHDGK
jgi:hypothetical protein